jgi:hypothetical protein
MDIARSVASVYRNSTEISHPRNSRGVVLINIHIASFLILSVRIRFLAKVSFDFERLIPSKHNALRLAQTQITQICDLPRNRCPDRFLHPDPLE